MLLIYLLEVTFFILKGDILPTAPGGFEPLIMESKSIALHPWLRGYKRDILFFIREVKKWNSRVGFMIHL